MLRGWVHSGFNVHRSRRVLPGEREDLERLAQYIIRNPFAVEKMRVSEATRANPAGVIIYHSGMNEKIHRNFEVFSPCDFIAAITQHIPDKSFHLNFASRQFGADARRERRRCISILQTARNVADAPKLRDHLFRRTSAFLQDAFITRWGKRKSGARNNLHAVFID